MLIGILGMGSIGQRHAKNLMTLGHQVISYDPLEPLFMSRERVINDADAVLICSPTKNHAEDLADVLRAGKHVMVEKPIGYDCPPLIAGMIMGARSKNPNLVVATGFNLRFHECVKQAKKIMRAGYLGTVQRATFSVLQKNDKPTYRRDGVIRNWMSHEIDLARHLLGELVVDEMDRIVTENGQDVEASIDFFSIEHSCPVTIHADYSSDPEVRQFFINGADGDMVVDLVCRTLLWGSNQFGSGTVTAKDSFDENYVDELKAFIQAIEGGHQNPLLEPCPLAGGDDGVAALQLVMDARKKAGLE